VELLIVVSHCQELHLLHTVLTIHSGRTARRSENVSETSILSGRRLTSRDFLRMRRLGVFYFALPLSDVRLEPLEEFNDIEPQDKFAEYRRLGGESMTCNGTSQRSPRKQ
jgi:hypothetical protein